MVAERGFNDDHIYILYIYSLIPEKSEAPCAVAGCQRGVEDCEALELIQCVLCTKLTCRECENTRWKLSGAFGRSLYNLVVRLQNEVERRGLQWMCVTCQQSKGLTPKPLAYQLVQNEALTDSELSSCKIDYAKLDAQFVGTHHPDSTPTSGLRPPETFLQFPGTQPPPVSPNSGTWPPQMFPQPAGNWQPQAPIFHVWSRTSSCYHDGFLNSTHGLLAMLHNNGYPVWLHTAFLQSLNILWCTGVVRPWATICALSRGWLGQAYY